QHVPSLPNGPFPPFQLVVRRCSVPKVAPVSFSFTAPFPTANYIIFCISLYLLIWVLFSFRLRHTSPLPHPSLVGFFIPFFCLALERPDRTHPFARTSPFAPACAVPNRVKTR